MQLPIGRDNFSELIDNQLDFVDKTLLIKEIIDDKSSNVILITRPRRFGKTLNLSMLLYFFAKEVYGRETHDLFQGLKIAQVEGDYLQYQGRYPVIFITFKDVTDGNFEHAYDKLYSLIAKIYDSHRYLQEGEILSPLQKRYFTAILEGKASRVQLESAFSNLTEYLFNYHKQKPIILIDEYDAPIQSSYLHGYYTEMITFMRNFFATSLKKNPYLHKAVLTGILRISKESLFSGLNNIEVYSVLRNEYSEYFGFTETEVHELLSRANLKSQANEIQQWYNGYLIGNTVIYNPWSIVNCIKQKGALRPYWVNTSGNELIREILTYSSDQFKTEFEELLQTGSVTRLINENFAFANLRKHPGVLCKP